ncbi:MAG: hypothetical protein IJW27_04120 [Clostridia bacterium]|nr:hypothetical protein [Clostridia bacterium]
MASNMDKKNDTKKEGGKGMGNPIAYIKHLMKDPINTIAEADARKKEIMPWLYGSIALAVVPSVLGGVIDALSFLTIFGMIGILATMFFGFLLFVIKKAKEKFKALTCNKCNKMAEIKTPEEFAKYISYTVGKNEAVFNGVSHPASNNGVVDTVTATASASVNVVIELKCPHCGEVKKLNYAISPFKCTAKQTKVAVRDVEFVKANLENKVRAVVADYNSDRRENIPYSIHSAKNPLFEQRTTFKGANSAGAHPDYNGVTIDKYIDPEEVVEQFFLINQLDGKITEA